MGRMTFINWDKPFYLDPTTLTPVESPSQEDTSGLIPVPTYGNWGGANYSQGDFGESPFAPLTPDEKPVDALDKLFMKHDKASFLAGDDPASQAAADLALVQGILRLNDSKLSDPEASLYAGIATLAMIEQITVSGYSLPLPLLLTAAADAYQNITYGLAGILANSEESQDLVTWLTQLGSTAPFSGTTTVV